MILPFYCFYVQKLPPRGKAVDIREADETLP